jgi:hypothetical protein
MYDINYPKADLRKRIALGHTHAAVRSHELLTTGSKAAASSVVKKNKGTHVVPIEELAGK